MRDWKKLVRHVQVERYYISKRYRSGAVAIEPQNLEPGHASLVEALSIAFQRSFLWRRTHGRFTAPYIQ